MQILKKRETPIQNIAYMGIMVAINVVAVILMNYVLPILFVPFMLILPFTSTVVTLFCKKIYFPFYLLATVGICLLVTLNNITDTLLYILPSLISGFLFGIAICYKLPVILVIFFTALVNLGLTYLSFPILKAIYGQDTIMVIAKLFNLDSFQYLYFVVPTFIMVISLIQETFTYFIIDSELPKLAIQVDEKPLLFIREAIGIFGSIMALVCYLAKSSFFGTFALFFTTFAIIFAIYDIIEVASSKKFYILVFADGIALILGIIIFASLYSVIEKPYGLILINIFADLVIISHLLIRFFFQNKKINKTF